MENKMAMEPLDWVCTNHLSFLLEHGNICVAVVKKKKNSGKRPVTRSQFTVQQHTYLRRHTVKPKSHKNNPMSNHDLLEWCRYMNIPIKSVLARDQPIPHNHQQSLFIYNLEPSFMNVSHWVATYVKDGVINYFDSFGMSLFQEIVDHAGTRNLTLLHQDQQL